MKKESVYVLMQVQTHNRFWTESIIAGMSQAAGLNRDTLVCIYPNDLNRLSPDLCGKPVLIVGNTESWLTDTVQLILSIGAKPIIVNASMTPSLRMCCSGVVFDIEEGLRSCEKYLRQTGRDRIALLGINPSSVADQLKYNAFFSKKDIVYSLGSIEDCVSDFVKNLPGTAYNAVLCANDTVAICLMHQLVSAGYHVTDEIAIMGIGNSYLGANLEIPLTSLSFDYHEMGVQAVSLYRALAHKVLSGHITISLPCTQIVRASTPRITASQEDPVNSRIENEHYFSGNLVDDILQIEDLLQKVTPIDREIILALLQNNSIENISDRIFLTPRGVRYRLERILKKYGIASRNDLVQMLSKVIVLDKTK